MRNLTWNDYGVRTIAKEKGVWDEPADVVDPYGNTVQYHVQLCASENGHGMYMLEIHYQKVLLVKVMAHSYEISTNEKLTLLIDEVFHNSYYRDVMSTERSVRYQKPQPEVSTKEDDVLKENMAQFLKELDELNEQDNPPTEAQLIIRYTKELEAFLVD